MMEAFLVPEKTVVNAKGDGPGLDVSQSEGRVFLLTLAITNIIEQESLDLSIFGSGDGATWDAKPVVAFPQKFYREEVPLLLNLTARSRGQVCPCALEVSAVGARDGRRPCSNFHVTLREVPQEILAEAAGRVRPS